VDYNPPIPSYALNCLPFSFEATEIGVWWPLQYISDESDKSRPEERVAATRGAIEPQAATERASSWRAVGLPDSYHHIARSRCLPPHARSMYLPLHLDQKMERENRFFDLEGDSGECFNSVRDGYGINIFKNGDRYIGFW
jgi:hypothetical protein